MSQIVQYNGVNINLATVTYSGAAQYDSMDRTLQVYKIVFKVSGIVSGEFEANIQQLHESLSTMGKEFLWQVNDSTVFCVAGYSGLGTGTAVPSVPSVQTNGYVDRRWGPKPRNIAIIQMHGGAAASVSMELETCISFGGDEASDVEEFSWAFSYAIDKNFSCVRTCNGKLVVKSPLNAADKPFTDPTFLPALPKGFQRDSQTYKLSPDGRVFEFTMVDKQVWRTLPAPITDGHASMVLDQRGAVVSKTLSGSFTAAFDVNKQVIAAFICDLIVARLPGIFPSNYQGNQLTTPNEFITDFSITNHEFENKIDFSISTKTSASGLKLMSDKPGGVSRLFASAFGDVALVPATTGAGYTVSNGIATNKGIGGTAKLKPVPAGPFAVANFVFNTSDADTKDVPEPKQVAAAIREDTPDHGTGFGITRDVGNATSAAHNAYPYISWVDNYHFVIDYNNKIVQLATGDISGSVAPAFNATYKDIVQQVARPKLTVIQSGNARRIGIAPEVPAFYTPCTGDIVTRRNEIRPDSGRLMGDGESREFHVSWLREIYIPNAFCIASVKNVGDDTNALTGLKLDRPFNATINETLPQFTAVIARHAIIEDTPDSTGVSAATYDDPSEPPDAIEINYPAPK
jgi:hypothetical protein